MFTSISWGDFLSVIVSILGIYYFISILLFYKDEIISFFKHSGLKRSTGAIKSEQTKVNEIHDLMGGVRYGHNPNQMIEREEVVSAEELNVAASILDEEELVIVDGEAENLRSDFVTIEGEIKSLSVMASLYRKGDSIPLFKTLLSNYPQFIGTEFQGKISQRIYDSCKRGDQHYFSLDEINSWWSEQDENIQEHH